MGSPHWPLFGIRVRTPRLELVHPDEVLVDALADLAFQGIHDPDTMPFSVPWTRLGPDTFHREYVRYHWRSKADLTPASWNLNFAVLVDGAVVGSAGLLCRSSFAVTRCFETGSWLGRRFQGQGLGTELRQACLHLGFAGLGATEATTACWVDNPASEGVTRKLGYEENGSRLEDREGAPVRMLEFRMTRAHWDTIRRDDITADGVEPCLPLLGLGENLGP